MLKPAGACVVVAVAVLLSFGRPRPAGAEDARTESARAHSQQGDAYYKLEKYANAIAEYEQAYLAKADPSFLYNIAQCHRLMNNPSEAIKFYRRFLKDAPSAPNRAIAEKHIKDLETARPAAAPPAPPRVQLEPRRAEISPSAPAASAAVPAPPPPAPPASSATVPPPPVASRPALELSAPSPTSSPVATLAPGENGAATASAESHPIYTRWWFWTAIGAVVLTGVVIAGSAKHDPTCMSGYTCK